MIQSISIKHFGNNENLPRINNDKIAIKNKKQFKNATNNGR